MLAVMSHQTAEGMTGRFIFFVAKAVNGKRWAYARLLLKILVVDSGTRRPRNLFPFSHSPSGADDGNTSASTYSCIHIFHHIQHISPTTSHIIERCTLHLGANTTSPVFMVPEIVLHIHLISLPSNLPSCKIAPLLQTDTDRLSRMKKCFTKCACDSVLVIQ
jgi:hypothetical protein